MSRAICRLNDVVTGRCEASAPGHPRDFTGVWTTCSDIVTCDGLGVVRVGDTGITDCDHTFIAVEGSDISTADGLGVVRVDDVVLVIEGGVGVCVTGSEVGSSN